MGGPFRIGPGARDKCGLKRRIFISFLAPSTLVNLETCRQYLVWPSQNKRLPSDQPDKRVKNGRAPCTPFLRRVLNIHNRSQLAFYLNSLSIPIAAPHQQHLLQKGVLSLQTTTETLLKASNSALKAVNHNSNLSVPCCKSVILDQWFLTF